MPDVNNPLILILSTSLGCSGTKEHLEIVARTDTGFCAVVLNEDEEEQLRVWLNTRREAFRGT